MTNITKNQGFNIGGVTKIEFAPFNYFDSIKNDETDINISDIVFKTGLSWINIYFTEGTAKYTDKSKKTASGHLYKHSIKLSIPKIRREVYKELYKYLGVHVVIKLTDANGSILIIGNKTEGLIIGFSKSVPSSTASYNGTILSILGSTTFPSLDVYS